MILGYRVKATNLALLIIVVLVLFFLFGEYWPLGPDYFYIFRPTTEAWFAGQTQLYDSTDFDYYNAPWGIFLITPTLLFQPNYGQSLLSLISLLGLVYAAYTFRSSLSENRFQLPVITLAIANLHTFDLLIRGNIDGYIVLGLALGYVGIKGKKPLLVGVGLWLLSIKPLYVLLPILTTIWLIRTWSRRDKIVLSAPLGITIIASFPLFGFNWPLRYIQFISTNPPLIYLQTSLWRVFTFFGFEKQLVYWIAIPILLIFTVTLIKTQAVPVEWLFSLSLTTNLTVAPYVLGSHYVLLTPTLVLLAMKNNWLIGIWFLSFTPLLRLIWGFEVAWVDVLYPFAMLLAVFVLIWQEYGMKQRKVNSHDT
jgi:hypothetical protein